MEPQQFTYWLQGFVELNGGQHPTPEQWAMICEHLQTVYVKITPVHFKPMQPILPDFPHNVPMCSSEPPSNEPRLIVDEEYYEDFLSEQQRILRADFLDRMGKPDSSIAFIC